MILICGVNSNKRPKTESDALREWTKQFGKTYGIYEGHLPILVTSDVDIIQEVFIKQFSSFIARKVDVQCFFRFLYRF